MLTLPEICVFYWLVPWFGKVGTYFYTDKIAIIVFVWSQYDGANIEQWAMFGAKTKKPN